MGDINLYFKIKFQQADMLKSDIKSAYTHVHTEWTDFELGKAL